MRNIIMLLACQFLGGSAYGQQPYVPPVASVSILKDISLSGTPAGQKFRDRFMECDEHDTCDGKPLRHGCSKDKNRNSVLQTLPGGTVFYDGKMGLDADGSPYSQKTPGATDQPQTSLRYKTPGSPSVNSDRVPYIVIPGGGFNKALGIQEGDVAAVVYGGKRVFAVIADSGPVCKLGEGSIQLHELLGHAVCKKRAKNGDCEKLANTGVEQDVLYFIFQGTHKTLLPGLTPENINDRIEAIGKKAWRQAGGR